MRVFSKVQKADTGADPAGANSPGRGSEPTSPSDIMRSLVARMTTPLLPDDYLHMVNPLWSARELRGKVVEVMPETDDAATLVIKPGWGWNIGVPARTVRRHRRPHRREMALALLFDQFDARTGPAATTGTGS